MSTFDVLISDLSRDANRVQPKDALQFCANWFQSRLEEQRARTRDVLSSKPFSAGRDLPSDLYLDIPFGSGSGPMPVSPLTRTTSPFSHSRPPHRASIAPGPFGTLNVPGNALLEEDPIAPPFSLNQGHISNGYSLGTASHDSGDYLNPPNAAIYARRTSISAESIPLGEGSHEPLPVYPKTPEQLERIKTSIPNNFIFRDLTEEQMSGILDAMQEKKVLKDELLIRQGATGDYFYVVESGLLNCYIRSEPFPPGWFDDSNTSSTVKQDKFLGEGDHPEFGKKVAECKPGSCVGELALMYNHARAASVLCMESSTLWALDRITFRTIILQSSYKRRTMYEQFLSTVDILEHLDAAQRSKIADALYSTQYGDGEAVVRQGDIGDAFFLVEEGEAIVTKTRDVGGELKETEVGHYKKGDYFGELSLLRLEPRAATVSAIERTDLSKPQLKVAVLDAMAFTRLLGPLREILERKASKYGSRPMGGRMSISQ